MSIVWGAVCRPKQGQTISGDTYVVHETDNQTVLASVIDGLGGGEAAATASGLAAEVLRTHPSQPLDALIHASHRALHGTRGAVIALLRLDLRTRQAYYVGVGNIGVYVYSSDSIKPISKNGILGYRLPTLLPLSYTYNSGDTFVLYSDGISARFSSEGRLNGSLPPQNLAEQILRDYGKTNDDATVVVVRDTG
jgi:serine phosphatase RsbU (regulator of sigma subunit)